MKAMEIMKGAESFRLEGNNKKAVLLLHGYTGTTAEMLPLGMYLNNLGYTVLGVRLPGHGTSVDDLEQTTASEWYDAAVRGCNILLKEFKEVYVAGLSMGALLAIKLAANKPVHKAVFISAPIFVCDWRASIFPILRFFIRYRPKRKRNYKDMQQYCQAYDKMPTKPLGSLFKMTKECKKLLPGIKIPCLIMQSKIEHTVKPVSAEYIYNNLGTTPENKNILWYNHSGHILTLDCEHEQVFAAIGTFFDKQ